MLISMRLVMLVELWGRIGRRRLLYNRASSWCSLVLSGMMVTVLLITSLFVSKLLTRCRSGWNHQLCLCSFVKMADVLVHAHSIINLWSLSATSICTFTILFKSFGSEILLSSCHIVFRIISWISRCNFRRVLIWATRIDTAHILIVLLLMDLTFGSWWRWVGDLGDHDWAWL